MLEFRCFVSHPAGKNCPQLGSDRPVMVIPSRLLAMSPWPTPQLIDAELLSEGFGIFECGVAGAIVEAGKRENAEAILN
jgi:hypothetical protein